MTTLPRAAALFISFFTLVQTAHAAPALAGRSVCDLVDRATVTSLFGKITETDSLPNACTFMTEYDGGMGMFGLMRHDAPVPEAQYREMTMRTGGDVFEDVTGVGEKAVINLTTHDMVMRVRGKVYVLSTRGMPCGSKKYGLPANDDEARKCDIKRNEALKQFGAQIAR